MNFYTDNESLSFYLHHPEMARVVAVKEKDYAEAGQHPEAPASAEEAVSQYDMVMNLVGEIAGEVIAPNAEQVDHEGPKLENGRVSYAPGTRRNLDALIQAGLYGISLDRKYNGLNWPRAAVVMAAEIIARADVGFATIWGLTDCADTIQEFGSDALKDKYLPRICQGATCSMDLTEPDAGSDLQSVRLKATYDEAAGCWRLNGVKRFITNGDADLHLVLARSEEGSTDGRGLSYFVFDRADGGMVVRRIENKMGIKGSPTCELVFRNAKAELCGSRKLGLIKYVMSLMNGARLGIAAQSVGLSQAAYNEALSYARDRQQFGHPIIEFSAVAELLATMKAKLDANRTILYETARFVDMYKTLEDISKERKLTPEERDECKRYNRMADAFTPLAKGLGSEFANQNAYDCIQVHGGSGFMKDYTCERLYRDARITSIYEGTTQLQVVAATRYATTGFYLSMMKDYAAQPVADDLKPMHDVLDRMTAEYEETVAYVMGKESQEFIELHARRMVEMAGYTIMAYLLMLDASRDAMFRRSAEIFLKFARTQNAQRAIFIKETDTADVETFKVK